MEFEELNIKTGMIGKCRDGEMITFVIIRGGLHYIANGSMWSFKPNYRDDGTEVIHRDHDIMAVYKPAEFDGSTIDFGEPVWERPADWSRVKVDTPILVSDDKKVWRKRHFARYEDGFVFAFAGGATSWSEDDGDALSWTYARLAF